MAQLYYQYGRSAALDENEDRGRMSSIYAMITSTNIRRWSPYYDDYISYFQGGTIGADPIATTEVMVYEGDVVNNGAMSRCLKRRYPSYEWATLCGCYL
jgi:hypothetical protein